MATGTVKWFNPTKGYPRAGANRLLTVKNENGLSLPQTQNS